MEAIKCEATGKAGPEKSEEWDTRVSSKLLFNANRKFRITVVNYEDREFVIPICIKSSNKIRTMVKM